MDRVAFQKIHDFYLHEKAWRNESRKFWEIVSNNPIGNAFKTMLTPRKNRQFREKIFRKFTGQMKAIALIKDKVIPAKDIVNTLTTGKSAVPVAINTLDFPYRYTHEIPFPIYHDTKMNNDVDTCFESVFRQIADFLKTK